jgi:hypothetical protein
MFATRVSLSIDRATWMVKVSGFNIGLPPAHRNVQRQHSIMLLQED